MLNIARLITIIFIPFFACAASAQPSEFHCIANATDAQVSNLSDSQYIESRTLLIHDTLQSMFKFAEPHCATGKHDPSFCHLVTAYKSYNHAQELLHEAATTEMPTLHQPAGVTDLDLMGLNWFSDAFSTDETHESLIKAIFIKAVAKSALTKSIEGVRLAIDQLPARRTYSVCQVPSATTLLSYSHPFLQAIMYGDSRFDIFDFGSSILSKSKVYIKIQNALRSKNSLPLAELDRLQQAYELRQFIKQAESLSLNDQSQILLSPESAAQIEGFPEYLAKVKELSLRPTFLNNQLRRNLYRATALVDEVVELVNTVKIPQSDTLKSPGQSSVYDDFESIFFDFDNYFSGANNEIINPSN